MPGLGWLLPSGRKMRAAGDRVGVGDAVLVYHGAAGTAVVEGVGECVDVDSVSGVGDAKDDRTQADVR